MKHTLVYHAPLTRPTAAKDAMNNDERTTHSDRVGSGTAPSRGGERKNRTALPLAIDDVVDGRYRVTGIVGRGGFGAVYSARHLVSNADVAIKVLLNRTQGDRDEAVERFFKEAQVLARLRHPNTVRVHDVGYTSAGDLYFAMELLQGPNLEQFFAAMGRAGRILSEPQAIDIASQVLGALGEAHKLNLVHRDLKPANIVLAEVPNEPYCVKVLDFGVVRTADSNLTTRQTAIGTPQYMSPEQCRSESIDGRADLYSVGVILFEAVCGHTPFPPGNPVDVMFEQMNSPVPELRKHSRQKHSPPFSLLVRKALAKDPNRRFQDAGQMRKALDVIRREAWGDVPIVGLDDLMERTDGAQLSSSFKVVIGDHAERGSTVAGVRAGKASQEATRPSDTRIDELRAATDRTRFDPASRLPVGDDGTSRPSSPSATPSRTPSRPHMQEHQRDTPVRLPTARPAPKWTVNSDAVRQPIAGHSQQVMNLPSQTEINRALERHVAEKARRKSEPAAPKRRPTEPVSPVPRSAQMAPPSAADQGGDDASPGRRRGKAKLGKGTMIGTGFPMPVMRVPPGLDAADLPDLPDTPDDLPDAPDR